MTDLDLITLFIDDSIMQSRTFTDNERTVIFHVDKEESSRRTRAPTFLRRHRDFRFLTFSFLGRLKRVM